MNDHLMLVLAVADLRVREDRGAAALRHRHPRRPRPPGQLRRAAATLLARTAQRLAGEPHPVPRQA